MMRFTVVWLEDARDDLARRWLAADDRNAVTQAAHSIDSNLAENPTEKGVLLREELWKYDEAPLIAYFTIREDDRIVEITNVV